MAARPAVRALAARALLRAELAVLEGRNRRFRSRLEHDPAAPAVVLSPHLDDAVLNCWSVLSGAAPLVVVNVFSGLPRAGVLSAWDAICGATDSRAQVIERMAEDARVLAPRRPVNLGFLDGAYRDVRSSPPSWRRLEDALRRRVAATSRIYAPLGVGHVDHATVRRYAAAVLRARGIPLRLYADVPYAVAFGWPAWVRGEPADRRLDVDAEWATWLRSVPELLRASEPRVVTLRPEHAAAKLAAMRGYVTQFAALDGGGLGRLSNQAIYPYEVFWDVAG